MEFIWNDGGRAACGFVGLAGDCVTRAIAIATGKVYRDVYEQLGDRSLKSPRNGVQTDVSSVFLAELGWTRAEGTERLFDARELPKGAVIVHIAKRNGSCGHFSAVIDHVVHDTWNPDEDACYIVKSYWTSPVGSSDSTLPVAGPKRKISKEQELTQQEFDKILRRLRALDNTASNDASTEGEKRNALRMMQSLMLTHNLTREDITDDDNVDQVLFSRVACPVNGSRACTWEKSLAWYVTQEVFPTVQWYRGTKQHRTLFWFYGPVADVQNCIALFRELLLTIATAAHLQYGGHVRGSGASYAEGYVAGLPRTYTDAESAGKFSVSENALIHTRSLALHDAAHQWLEAECNIKLTTTTGYGRYFRDSAAESRGKDHGSKHEITTSGRRKRITHR